VAPASDSTIPDAPEGPLGGIGPDKGPAKQWPGVSLIVVASELTSARGLVAKLLAEPYPGDFEIIVAAALPALHPSELDPLASLAEMDQRISLIHAKDDSLAALVNAAAYAARYPILSQVGPARGDWIELLRQAVLAMETTGADVVGGPVAAVGFGSAELAISRAMNSRLGVGPNRSRVGATRGVVDSVRMVAMRRSAFERVGGMRLEFVGAEDWELQHRVRRSGGMVWLDPSLILMRHPPSSTGQLAELFYRTGAVRRRITNAHPGSSTWRYLVPPVTVAGLAAAILGALLGAALGVGWMWWLLLTPVLYALAVGIGVTVAGKGLRLSGRVRMWWSVMVIHLSWGAGFLFGRRRSQPARH
jgi:hypothetical protein